MNAQAPLCILSSDDCWEQVHPDVVRIPGGYAGYPYWMAFTPYPKLDDRLENPTVRVSQDGVFWVSVPGLEDPLVPAPEDPEAHNADPDLVFCEGRLHLVYMTTNKCTKTTFSVVNSQDGLHWSKPRAFYEDRSGLSPACAVDKDLWHLWFIWLDEERSGPAKLLHREGPDLMHLEEERPCRLEIPGYVPWHIDVQRTDLGYEALIAAFPDGTDNSRTSLFHAVSNDGLSYVLSRKKPILAPSALGWDNRMIYRSSFLKEPDGTYRIWYSASSWGRRFGIGHVQGPLDALRETPGAMLAPLPFFPVKVLDDLKGALGYYANRILPERLCRLLTRST